LDAVVSCEEEPGPAAWVDEGVAAVQHGYAPHLPIVIEESAHALESGQTDSEPVEAAGQFKRSERLGYIRMIPRGKRVVQVETGPYADFGEVETQEPLRLCGVQPNVVTLEVGIGQRCQSHDQQTCSG
jgi:hypothetical protein